MRKASSFVGAVAIAASLLLATPATAAPTSDDFGGWQVEPTLTHANALAQGWTYTGTPAYDFGIVANGIGGGQSLRLSNAVMDNAFGDWLQSPVLAQPAAETPGGTKFTAEFDIKSATGSPQAGLQISIAPQAFGGARMSFLKFVDTGTGIDVQFADYPDGGFDGRQITIAKDLTYDGVHHVRIELDLYTGASNDVAQVYIDSNVPRIPAGLANFSGFFAPVDHPDTVNKAKAGQTIPLKFKVDADVATTWEDYYRLNPESNDGVPQANWTTRAIDSLIFQARQGSGAATNPGVAGAGYLIDNVQYDVTAGGTLPTGAAGDPSIFGTNPFSTTRINCDTDADLDTIEAYAPGATSLKYDAATGIWHYNWQTKNNDANTCARTYLTNLPSADALFKFVK